MHGLCVYMAYKTPHTVELTKSHGRDWMISRRLQINSSTLIYSHGKQWNDGRNIEYIRILGFCVVKRIDWVGCVRKLVCLTPLAAVLSTIALLPISWVCIFLSSSWGCLGFLCSATPSVVNLVFRLTHELGLVSSTQ
ncbi:uncharacterized protein EI90DRAFT_3033807 [Cantharellus anzutake]|uniref:uncharacterized protein n=1 Tax=Cantharellus anzutake TaxID=1750568 RepID=UPI00190743EB|nr:uncharacterized protein EI90DRAFT_3033807 [Cantharellus anzutake]KAF8341390.1 hypothetical protein EI90DRAFT_3033807 [Cantharellus anzutake]